MSFSSKENCDLCLTIVMGHQSVFVETAKKLQTLY